MATPGGETNRKMPVAGDSVSPRSPFCASDLCFELGHVQDDDFAAFQTNDASVNKSPEVAGNQITDCANLRADLLVGFFQGKLEAASSADAQPQSPPTQEPRQAVADLFER